MTSSIFSTYFGAIREHLEPPWFADRADAFVSQMLETKKRGGKVLLAGNGASASIASHFALDFTKQGTVRSLSFNDAALLTAYGNDYGYENWVAQAIAHHSDPGDLVVLISSSGSSPNVVQGAKAAKAAGLKLVTFTGFAEDNALKSLGETSFWLGSTIYNVVESVHATWLGAICDQLSARASSAS